MTRKRIAFASAAWGALISIQTSFFLAAQFTPAELGERPRWEQFLETAKIVGQKQLLGPGSVTKPWELTLEKDGVIRKALWKSPQGGSGGVKQIWKWEIAAYRLDKYLGLNMIPPAVEKKFGNKIGCCELWIDSWINLVPIYERRIKVPPDKEKGLLRGFYLQRAFDNLIANEDRHQRNFLITGDWRMILIDHGRSFRSFGPSAKTLIYDENHQDGPMIMKELPRAFVDRLRTLNPKVMKGVVNGFLTGKEIECVLARRDLILEWIDKSVRELGEDQVLY